jgi:hypothetical protein
MTNENISLLKIYGEDEYERFYAISRYLIQSGQFHTAEVILKGLTAVRPDKTLAWLGRCYIHAFNNEFELLLESAKQGLKTDKDNIGLRIFLIIGLFAQQDFAPAGTELGELGDLFELTPPEYPSVYRLYKSQLARYENAR